MKYYAFKTREQAEHYMDNTVDYYGGNSGITAEKLNMSNAYNHLIITRTMDNHEYFLAPRDYISILTASTLNP